MKKYNQAFVEAIKQAATQAEILQIWEQMKAKSFLNYNVDLQKQETHMQNFKKQSLADSKQELIACLDKNQLYVNLSSLHDSELQCTEVEKTLTNNFYQTDSRHSPDTP